jgi:hypothetical protein
MPKKLKTEVSGSSTTNQTEPAIKAPEPVVEPVKKVRKPRVKKVVEKSKSKSVEKVVEPKATDEPKKQKAKKAPSKFAIFMKANYEKVKHLENKKRLGELAKMYKQSNSQ